ncbi:glycosyltransferase family 47 protein [Calocera viscosa TUFC12733]|uniref:Glycosyltransferase family 47 protein n=1 Tax=Calocera viscosa (strain TUFC12733) TaxID=1330018 RepID=A0A167QHH9_CALVF|nr:glycosyltransferase family 47 protein [Calocera viscosa TUFC12733]
MPFNLPSRAAHRWIGVAVFALAVLTAFLFFAESFSLHFTYRTQSSGTARNSPWPAGLAKPPSSPGDTIWKGHDDLENLGDLGSPPENRRPEVYHKDSGRIVVTGGGGNIGKHMVRRLLATSTPVTVLDVEFKSDELEEIYGDFPVARELDLLRVVIGDIRNVSALNQAITEDVVGVVHLAAVSRVLWCLENEADCLDVNERGTQLVLDALTQHGTRKSIRPWFILASSREVYGNAKSFPVAEDAERIPANVYGASKLKAETVVENHLAQLEKAGSKAGSMHAIALRLSNVYGGEFDHLERLIPSIATQALSHMPIQIVGGAQNLDMLHIDDCIDAFLLAIRRLSSSVSGNRFTTPRTSLDQFNVANGKNVPAQQLVDKLLQLARSKSPIQRLKGDNRFPDSYTGSTVKAEQVLGYRAQVSIDEGLLRLVRLYLHRTQRFLTKKIGSQCYDKAPELAINTQIEKLHDCMVHVTANIGGRLATVTPDNQRFVVKDSFPAAPFASSIQRGPSGKYLLRLRDWHWPFMFLGLKTENFNQPGSINDGIADDQEAEVWWEMEVSPEQAAIKLILPGSDYQLSPPNFFSGNFSWEPRTADIYPFKITPICCPSPAPWPFADEDPIDHSIDFLRTSTMPQFTASIPKAECQRMTRALDKIKRDLATLSVDLLNGRNGIKTRLGPASDWTNAGLPVCTNMCDHPMVCVDTGDCQCVLSACPSTSRFPFAAFANLPQLSYPPTLPHHSHDPSHADHNPLLEMVERSSWRNVLRPQASRYIGTNEPWPKIHVAGHAPTLQTWLDSAEGQTVGTLTQYHCFSADISMELPLREINVPAEEAEMIFMPFYHNRASWLWNDEWDFMRDTIPKLDPHKMVIPFTHDYGACWNWDWDLWKMRAKFGRSPETRDVVAWSVMADMNGPCYNPLQDVVIPPRTCASPQLVTAFSDMAKVRPASQRTVLATFKGSYWGTGANTRRKLNCEKRLRNLEDAVSPKLVTPQRLVTVWDTLSDYESYPAILNDTIFCPLPEGVTGWATRLEDVIYAGCIPVFIGHSSQYPFFDMLDWSKLSITVERKDLQRMEEMLMSYTLEEIERLQTNLMLVRDAFLYPLDGKYKDQLTMRGPLFFAMHSTKMRMLTQYPSDVLVDRPDWTDGRS